MGQFIKKFLLILFIIVIISLLCSTGNEYENSTVDEVIQIIDKNSTSINDGYIEETISSTPNTNIFASIIGTISSIIQSIIKTIFSFISQIISSLS